MTLRSLAARTGGAPALAVLTALTVCSCFGSHTPPDETAQAPAGLRLLTRAQYVRSIRFALTLPETMPIPEVGDHFAEREAATGEVATDTVEAYWEAAFAIAEAAIDDPAQRAVIYGDCTPTTAPDDACARSIVAAVGRRAFRRALTDEELTLFSGLVASIGVELEDVNVGVAMALAGLLQAPSFLYRVELPETEPPAHRRRYDADALATRLSYFLWDAPPDDVLLDAAARGDLADARLYDATVARMIADERVRDGVNGLVADLFLADAQRCVTEPCPDLLALGPQLSATVIPALLEGGFPAMLTTRTVAMSDAHASFYGLETGSFGPALVPVTLSETDVRVGVLGTPAFAAAHGVGATPLTVGRGAFVVERLLCEDVPVAPMDHAEALDPELSARAQLAATSAAACAGCHERMDAIGLGLERFRGTGGFRDRSDDGEIIDPSGVLDGVVFADERGLASAIAGHPSFTPCMSSHLLSRALGTVADPRGPGVNGLAGPEVRAVLAAVARSDSFRLTVGEAP
jgi:hypothetical protein